MSNRNELYSAAERLCHAVGAKPKNPADIIAKLEAEGYVLTVEGGLLSATHTGTPMNAGTLLQAYRQKNPRDFFGEAGGVRFKSDLAGDNAAKSRWIREHSFAEWEALPYDEKSLTARNVKDATIAHAGMRAAEYARLSLAEKAKLASEIGAKGIERILTRR